MDKIRQAGNDYMSQIVTAIIALLVIFIPGLEPYREALIEIVLIFVALIIGQSIQKAGR